MMLGWRDACLPSNSRGGVPGDPFHFLPNVAVMALLVEVHGIAMHRELIPSCWGHSGGVWRDGNRP